MPPGDATQQQMGYNQNGNWFNGTPDQMANGMGNQMFSGQDMNAWGGYGHMQNGWSDGYSNMMGKLTFVHVHVLG